VGVGIADVLVLALLLVWFRIVLLLLCVFIFVCGWLASLVESGGGCCTFDVLVEFYFECVLLYCLFRFVLSVLWCGCSFGVWVGVFVVWVCFLGAWLCWLLGLIVCGMDFFALMGCFVVDLVNFVVICVFLV